MFSNFCGDAFGGGGCLLLVAGSKFLGHLGVLGFCCVFLSGFCCHRVVASIDCPRFLFDQHFSLIGIICTPLPVEAKDPNSGMYSVLGRNRVYKNEGCGGTR